MKKIIPSYEAGKFFCPMGDACSGDKCMKWEEETMLQKKKDYVEPKGFIASPLTGYEEVPTGKGFCGL